MLLWGGQTVNLFGSQVSWLAVPMVAIVTLHATKFQVAALGAVEALPALLASLPAGVVVDRHRRKPLMIGCAVRARRP
jgi:MFS family permease